jgi:hypothetical protein
LIPAEAPAQLMAPTSPPTRPPTRPLEDAAAALAEVPAATELAALWTALTAIDWVAAVILRICTNNETT